jgi:hypothetical protein
VELGRPHEMRLKMVGDSQRSERYVVEDLQGGYG